MSDAASGVLLASLEGTTLSLEEERFFSKESPAGITLFKRNVPSQLRELNHLTSELQNFKGRFPPCLVAIDQEGGRVGRLGKMVTDLGPAEDLAGGDITEQALATIRAYGKKLGQELLSVGINVNFAPVLDINTEPTNLAIGNRCFGSILEQAVPRARAFFEGQESAGILGCLKHFPGQGDAKVDTHIAQAPIDLDEETLFSREIAAFENLLPQAPMVMISHCIYPVFSSEPASLSDKVITGILKEKLGFSGVVVSDDMTMGAIAQDEKDWQEQIVLSLAAGTDLILVCKLLDRAKLALEAIRREMARSRAFTTRLDEAATKVMDLRRKVPGA